MNEKTLLPCPFCGGAAEIRCFDESMDLWSAECDSCQVARLGDSKQEAVTAWNTRTTLPAESQHCDTAKYADNCNSCGFCDNQPLTLEELREMDGEPVWIVPINLHEWLCDKIDGKPAYGLVRKSWVRIWREETADLVHSDFDFEDYNKTWTAYRQKPPRGE